VATDLSGPLIEATTSGYRTVNAGNDDRYSMIETQKITGRTPVPMSKKLNPIWWFGNDLEQALAEAPWYMPDAPQWKRRLFWEFRNRVR
jgi:hypothetical protein